MRKDINVSLIRDNWNSCCVSCNYTQFYQVRKDINVSLIRDNWDSCCVSCNYTPYNQVRKECIHGRHKTGAVRHEAIFN